MALSEGYSVVSSFRIFQWLWPTPMVEQYIDWEKILSISAVVSTVVVFALAIYQAYRRKWLSIIINKFRRKQPTANQTPTITSPKKEIGGTVMEKQHRRRCSQDTALAARFEALELPHKARGQSAPI